MILVRFSDLTFAEPYRCNSAANVKSTALAEVMELFQLDEERLALDHHAGRANRIERADHAAVASERLVGVADDQPVGRGDRGGGAELARDLHFIAMRIEHAGRGKGAC